MNAMKALTVASVLALAPAGAIATATEVSSEIVLPASPRAAHDPCVAHGEGAYLAVWQSGRAEKADLYACRLDASGKALDARAFAVSRAVECQERPRAS
jgi:hypothetical protein